MENHLRKCIYSSAEEAVEVFSAISLCGFLPVSAIQVGRPDASQVSERYIDNVRADRVLRPLYFLYCVQKMQLVANFSVRFTSSSLGSVSPMYKVPFWLENIHFLHLFFFIGYSHSQIFN